MSGGRFDLDRAKRDAETARQQLADTIAEIQGRLHPRVLLGQAWDDIKDKSGTVADDAVNAVRERPVAASGIAAALGLFLARKPIGRLISGLAGKSDTVAAGPLRAEPRIDLTAPVLPAQPDAIAPARARRAKSEGAKA